MLMQGCMIGLCPRSSVMGCICWYLLLQPPQRPATTALQQLCNTLCPHCAAKHITSECPAQFSRTHHHARAHTPQLLPPAPLCLLLHPQGNCLPQVPSSITQLVHLEDLNISGNSLAAFPEGIEALTGLHKLSLHGNQLQRLPQDGWQHLQQLDEVCLQGNLLTAVPDSLAKLGVSLRSKLQHSLFMDTPWTPTRTTTAAGNPEIHA